MTGIVIALDTHQALIATDSVASCSPDHRPVTHTTKAVYIPHMRMAVVHTGLVTLQTGWLNALEQDLDGDILDIDRAAPDYLGRLWEFLLLRGERTRGDGCVFLHIGFPRRSELLHGFRYDASNGFRTQKLEIPGYFTSPQLLIPPGAYPPEVAKMGIYAQQAAAEKNGRPLAIAGDIFTLHITKSAAVYQQVGSITKTAQQVAESISKARADREARLEQVRKSLLYRLKKWLQQHE